MISILTYHRMGNFERPPIHPGIHCNVADFRGHLRVLARLGFPVISLEEVCNILFRGAESPGRAVALTFDDGYHDFYEHALPVLQEQGCPATLFAVSGRLGATADWDSEPSYAPPPLATAATLRSIAAAGVEIGSHAHTHPRLTTMDDGALREEISGSKKVLEDVLGRPVRFFSYPFGDQDPRVRDAVREAGYEAAVTTRRSVAEFAPGPFEIPRKGVGFGLGPAALLWKVLKRGRREATAKP